jgi:hypothetical protein
MDAEAEPEHRGAVAEARGPEKPGPERSCEYRSQDPWHRSGATQGERKLRPNTRVHHTSRLTPMHAAASPPRSAARGS